MQNKALVNGLHSNSMLQNAKGSNIQSGPHQLPAHHHYHHLITIKPKDLSVYDEEAGRGQGGVRKAESGVQADLNEEPPSENVNTLENESHYLIIGGSHLRDA